MHDAIQAIAMALVFLRHPHGKAPADRPEERAARQGRIRGGRQAARDLRAEQLEPATVRQTAVRREDAREERADEAADAVAHKCVQPVVDPTNLELERRVRQAAPHRAHHHCAHGRHESRGRRDDDEPDDKAGNRPDRRYVPVLHTHESHPYDQAGCRSQTGVQHRQRCGEVGGQRGTAVEAQPTEPQQGPAQDHEGHAVRLRLLGVRPRPARPEECSQDEGGGAGAFVHDGAASEILCAQLVDPAAGAPDPVADRGVHHEGPQENEDNVRAEPHPFDHGARDDGGPDDREGHLESHEEQRRHRGLRPNAVLQAVQPNVCEVPNQGRARAERKGKAEQAPRDGDHSHGDEAHHHGVEHVAAVHEAPVKKCQPWSHQQHERGAAQEPRSVACIDALHECAG
eukprot:CAMPEP_0198525122 /NCGR_PEP_ID=MMETSP1462-20131121/23158_1 /TAXON_ID=1333877 /ORGANISM="Brandtodinium nutriculum, Strain RCC3387" /LENGTH=399 /DNA_ID=CAMNT_0044254867 /DNA_START=127 /DNA_END=1323 /DNA_ORIENTATION=+